MSLNLVPSGNIGLTDLIQRIVQKLYGLDAVAPAKIYESGGQLVVFRAGTKISYTDETARWESTQEAIRQVFATGAATALVMNTNGDELTIPQDYWDCGSAWRPLLTGRFEYDRDPTVHRRPVYLRQSECEEILERCLRPDEQSETVETDETGLQRYERWANQQNQLIKDGSAKNWREAAGIVASKEGVDRTTVEREARRIRREKRGK